MYVGSGTHEKSVQLHHLVPYVGDTVWTCGCKADVELSPANIFGLSELNLTNIVRLFELSSFSRYNIRF
jgi:hypothetical protein